MTAIEQLLSEFIEAWNAGRRPDLEAYLERAPEDQRDELADEIETWLMIAPPPAYDEATRAEIAADPILIAALAAGAETVTPWATRVRALRERAGLKIEQVAERLGAALKLPAEPRRTTEYLTRAERGEFDERRLSRRLVTALATVLGADPDELRPAWPGPALTVQHYRTYSDAPIDQKALRKQFDAVSRAASVPPPSAPPLDELDRLFLGGPDA